MQLISTIGLDIANRSFKCRAYMRLAKRSYTVS